MSDTMVARRNSNGNAARRSSVERTKKTKSSKKALGALSLVALIVGARYIVPQRRKTAANDERSTDARGATTNDDESISGDRRSSAAIAVGARYIVP